MNIRVILILFLIPCLCFGDDSILDLNEFRVQGDFVNENRITKELELKLPLILDPVERMILRKQLYLEAIELPGDIFF